MARASTRDPAMPRAAESQPPYDTPKVGPYGGFVLSGALLAYALVLAALTPYTLSLDEIKLPIFLSLGSLLVVATLAAFPIARPIFAGRRAFAWLAAYLAVCAVSTLLSAHRWVGALTLYSLWAGAGFFLAFALLAQTRRAVFAAIGAVLAIAFLEQAEAYWHYLDFARKTLSVLYSKRPGGIEPGFYDLLLTLASTRNLMGTILNEDFYAAYLLTIVPLAAAGAAAYRAVEMRLLSYAVALMAVAGIFITLSKDSLIALAAQALVLALLWPRVKSGGRRAETDAGSDAKAAPLWKSPVFLGGAAFLLLLGAALAWTIRDRIAIEVQTIGSAFSSRRIIYTGALRIFADFPIFGGGPGTFRIYFPLVRDADYFLHEISNVTVYAHSHYLDVLAETGLLGFVTFVGFLGSIVWAGLRSWRRTRPADRPLALMQAALLASMAGLGIQMCFSPVTRWTIGMTILSSLLGLAYAAFQLGEPTNTTAKAAAPSPSRSRSLATGARGGLMAFAFVAFFLCTQYGLRHWKGARIHNRGMIELENRQFAAAADLFRKTVEINPWFVTSYYKLGHAIHSHAMGTAVNLEDMRAAADETDAVYEQLESYWPRYAEVSYNRALIFRSIYQRSLRVLERTMFEDTDSLAAGDLEPYRDRLEGIAALSDSALDAAQFYRKQSIKFTAADLLGEVLMDRAEFVERFGEGFGIDGDPSALYRTALNEYRAAEQAFGEQEGVANVQATPAALARIKSNQFDCLIKMSDWETAAEVGEKLYRLDPTDSELASRIIDLQLIGRGDADRAVRLARQFVDDAPLDPHRRLDLITAAIAVGDRDMALSEIEATLLLAERIEARRGDATVRAFAGILARLKNDALAIEQANGQANEDGTQELAP